METDARGFWRMQLRDAAGDWLASSRDCTPDTGDPHPPRPVYKARVDRDRKTSLARFGLGVLTFSDRAVAHCRGAGVSVVRLVGRHVHGDHGDAAPGAADGAQASSYPVGAAVVRVVTDRDRTLTTIDLADDP